MTVGVNAVWGSWMCCEMFWRTMSSGLESLEAFYEVMDMDSSESNEGKIAYTSRERTSMAGDIVGRGMEIEFRCVNGTEQRRRRRDIVADEEGYDARSNVTFRYPNASKNSLEDVSFVILPGELAYVLIAPVYDVLLTRTLRSAIVGHNGSGTEPVPSVLALLTLLTLLMQIIFPSRTQARALWSPSSLGRSRSPDHLAFPIAEALLGSTACSSPHRGRSSSMATPSTRTPLPTCTVSAPSLSKPRPLCPSPSTITSLLGPSPIRTRQEVKPSSLLHSKKLEPSHLSTSCAMDGTPTRPASQEAET